MFYLSDLFILGFNYLFLTSFENALHKASHHKSSGKLYRWHKLHHKDYPVTRLESDTYIDSSDWFSNMFAIYSLSSMGILYFASSHRVFAIISTEALAYSMLITYLHEQFHLKKSWLLKYKWFKRHKRKHLIHHIKQDKNFSFLTTNIDKLQNSYLCDNERLNTVISNS